MNWKQATKDFEHYLKLERGLSANSIKNYILDGIFWIIVFSIIVVIYQYFSNVQDENNDVYESLITGIISGIVTALIIFIIQILWHLLTRRQL